MATEKRDSGFGQAQPGKSRRARSANTEDKVGRGDGTEGNPGYGYPSPEEPNDAAKRRPNSGLADVSSAGLKRTPAESFEVSTPNVKGDRVGGQPIDEPEGDVTRKTPR